MTITVDAHAGWRLWLIGLGWCAVISSNQARPLSDRVSACDAARHWPHRFHRGGRHGYAADAAPVCLSVDAWGVIDEAIKVVLWCFYPSRLTRYSGRRSSVGDL
jgi:hypothetical protein